MLTLEKLSLLYHLCSTLAGGVQCRYVGLTQARYNWLKKLFAYPLIPLIYSVNISYIYIFVLIFYSVDCFCLHTICHVLLSILNK